MSLAAAYQEKHNIRPGTKDQEPAPAGGQYPDTLPVWFDSWDEYEDYLDDPRPDLSADHDRWAVVLKTARQHDADVFTRLHVLRCGGAKITEKEGGGLELVGRYTDTSEWSRPGEWEQDVKELLKPYTDVVTRLLREAQQNE